MTQTDFLIVGGNAAGTTAAETIRNLKPNATITIINEENHPFYSRVLLPHYIRGKVKREQVFLRNDEHYKDSEIDLIKGVGVKGINVSDKKVTLSNGDEIVYGKLLLSTGGDVIPLKIPGSNSKNIFYMRTIEDADGIIKAAKAVKKGVIIGGGFIGLEFTSGLIANGVNDVTLLVLEDYYWQGKLDADSSVVLQKVLERNGVKIVKQTEVKQFEVKDGKVRAVITKDNKKIEAEIVGVGIGIKPDFSYLDGSGIKIDRGIVTNEFLETNISDVYAAGDCTQFYDVIFEREHGLGNWANATSQGAAVGKTMAGEKTVFETASSYSISYFDGTCTFVGVTDEKYADEIISRGSLKDNKMTRIFIKKIKGIERVVGATIINSVADVAPLTAAVKSKIDIEKHKEKLSELGFDLNDLNS